MNFSTTTPLQGRPPIPAGGLRTQKVNRCALFACLNLFQTPRLGGQRETSSSPQCSFFKSLRNDNKISRQSNLHFQNFIVVAFPTKKNSVLDNFPLCPQGLPPQKKRKLHFYCRLAVSDSWAHELQCFAVTRIAA